MSLYRRKTEQGSIYWFHGTRNGKHYQQSTAVADKNQARAIEAAFWTNLARGEVDLPPNEEPSDPTIHELIARLESQWKLECGELGKRDLSNFKVAREVFPKNPKARAITTADVEKYIAKRQKEGCAPATINRALLLIRQSFAIGKITPPEIRHLSEKGNTRHGFFSSEEFHAVCSYLPSDLADFCEFAYTTGWRKGEISSLVWSDLNGDELHLRDSKNGEGRTIIVAGNLVPIIARRRERRMVGDRMSHFIFHRGGEQIKEFRKSWGSACRKAGVPGRLVHDLRRCGVRNMVRSGTPQSVAMQISGHKTISMFQRYDICNADDMQKAMESVAAYHARKVVSIAQ
jgi:integrase